MPSYRPQSRFTPSSHDFPQRNSRSYSSKHGGGEGDGGAGGDAGGGDGDGDAGGGYVYVFTNCCIWDSGN